MKLNLIVAGVGGQGNILASQVVAKAAMAAGYNVVNTETKGAAQRGGSVVSHVRIAEGTIYSPLVPPGRADVLLGFEPLEALRYLGHLKAGGWYVINTTPIPTILANLGIDAYPTTEEIAVCLAKSSARGYCFDATAEARQLGDVLLTNVVMLGAFSTLNTILAPEALLSTLLATVSEKFHAADKAAFKRGQELITIQQQHGGDMI